MADKPIVFTEHVQLTALGIQPQSISFQSLTLESDHFICIRETVNDTNQVVIVDLADANNIMRRPITADSAIMHPKEKIMALKAGRQLQVFNLATKTKLGSHVMNEDVTFWAWINDTTLGLVTEHSVYHWKVMEGQAAPTKVFDRHNSLAGNQIINYRVSPDGQWLVLVGISSNPAAGQPGSNAFKIKGSMQLYSVERGVSQPIEGHAAAFTTVNVDGAANPTKLFAFAVRTGTGAKLHIVEIGHQAPNAPFAKKAVDVFFPPEATNDFPVAMQVSQKHGIIYLVTKFGFIHLYEVETGQCIYMNRISGETIFTTAPYEQLNGIIGVNRKGQVLSVSVDEDTIVPYVQQSLNNPELAIKLATRAGLPGADNMIMEQYNRYLQAGQYGEAAKIAANSPRGILRTPQTIETFKKLPNVPGTLSPILQYFGILLEKGELNKYESLELARPVIQQGKKQLLEKWLKENKLECSEELGDMVRTVDMNLALSVYLRANVPNKVVACFAELGQFDKIVLYSKKVGYTPDYANLLQHLVRINPDKGAEFATQLVNDEAGPMVDLDRVVDIFMAQNMIQQCTSFLLDALKDNKPEQGPLQTRLLEMNLINAPQVADAILGNEMFTHYDRPRIANLAEKAGLVQRALEHYEDINDIKRVVVHTNLFNTDWLVNYFGRLTVEQSFESMREMLKSNIRQNLPIVIQIATKYSDLLGPVKLIELFEQFKSSEGLYYYLGSIVNLSEDPEVHFKYIQAATRTGQIREVERIARESNFYNPEKVKNFLKEAKLSDQLPLIIVCDRFDFVHDLVLYLYQNGLTNFIEIYVQRVNAARTPQVIGGLLDVDCDESTIKGLLMSVTGTFPIEELVEEVEKRNRLKLILPWLQSKVEQGSTDPAVYNAIAKISIDSNNNPEAFLKENNLYDPATVGKYCEKRDPYLAYIAYAKGFCDDDLIRVTNDNQMYKHQARYLVKRRDVDLWTQVLNPESIHRRALVDQVVATAIPECTDPDDVSVTVKAFMHMELHGPLIELLEKIILEPSPFSDNKSLQSLMFLTAIRNDKGKVMGYINKLEGYDVETIAKVAIEAELYEEAFTIYQKHNMHAEAMNVLVEHMVSIDRGFAYANKINEPAVWSRLGKAQLDGLRIKDAIDSYIKAGDPGNYKEVIEIANRAGKEDVLIKFLQMARKTLREPEIDTELAYCYAVTDRLPEMEEFLNMTNVADILRVGEKCFDNELYEAAKLLFASIQNYARLATTLIYLGESQSAVEAARKAGNTAVWQQVHAACVDRKEFKLAQIAGLNLIVHAEQLPAVLSLYERNGYFDQVISLLEAGLGLERAHMGLYTGLAVLYAKYRADALMEYLKLYSGRINLSVAVRTTETAALWPELVFCYMAFDEPDNAALAMMERGVFDHEQFKKNVAKVSNLEIIYRACSWYLANQPLLISDLLSVVSTRVDPGRVVGIVRAGDNLPLIKQYLIATLPRNIKAVNESYFDLLIEEEDWMTLRDAVQTYDAFDLMTLASRLSTHELLEFRRLAALLYRKAGKWEDSISLSRNDRLVTDQLETAHASNDFSVVEDLVSYFVTVGDKTAYTASLYVLYDLLHPDFIDELSWRYGLGDNTRPYTLQQTRSQSQKLAALQKELAELKLKQKSSEPEEDTGSILGSGLGGRLLIGGPGAGMNGGMGGMPPQATGFMGAQPTGFY